MDDQAFTEIRQKIEGLEQVISDHADISEGQRHLSDKVAFAMAREGLFRVAAPLSVGGGEHHPVTQVKTIEAVSTIDGSTGWNLMIGIENLGILAACFPEETADRIYSDPELIISGALNPLGIAVREEGGYRINGQWPFASGAHNAHYFWGQCIVHENGEAISDDRGVILCEALVPKGEFEILDTWHVSGLRGSGSHDVKIENVFVPDEMISQAARRPVRESGTLYQIPLYTRLAYNKVGVATGIARSAIDHFTHLSTVKTPRGHRNKLQERVDAQRAVAEAELLLGSARSFVFDMISDVWDTIEKGNVPTTRQKALVQLACSGAASTSVDAVQKVHAVAGATANFKSSPLERCMRDVMVVRQHIMVSPQFTESIGRALLGLKSGTFLF